jgi:hypothetical protein
MNYKNEKEVRTKLNLQLKNGTLENRAFYGENGCIWDAEQNCWLAPNAQVKNWLLSKGAVNATINQVPVPIEPKAMLPFVNKALPKAPEMPNVVLPPPGVVLPSPQELPKVQESPKVAEVAPIAAPTPVKRTLKALTLPPSFIVVVEVSVLGEVMYKLLNEEDSSKQTDGYTVEEKIKTTKKTIVNREEYVEAEALAGQLRVSLRRLGRTLHAGVLIIPRAEEKALDETITEVKERALKFNEKSRNHQIKTAILKAALTDSVDEAAKEIVWNIQELMSEMQKAIDECNIDRIRDVAGQAKKIIPILPEKESNLLASAITAARSVASTIKKELGNKASQIALIRRELDTSAIDMARAAFLEYAIPDELVVAKSVMEPDRASDLEDDMPVGDFPKPSYTAVGFDVEL